jgi:F0F1-type ATP synthase membrane subunit b/b'
MEPATLSLILTAIQGPAAALVVSLLMMYAFLQFLIKHVLPKQDQWIEKALEESREARKTFEAAVAIMASRLTKVDESVVEIGHNIKDIEKDVESIKKTISKRDQN